MRTTSELKKWKRVNAITTRGRDIVSTIRATLWKNSKRNVLMNITDGIGYEGVIEYWERDDSDWSDEARI